MNLSLLLKLFSCCSRASFIFIISALSSSAFSFSLRLEAIVIAVVRFLFKHSPDLLFSLNRVGSSPFYPLISNFLFMLLFLLVIHLLLLSFHTLFIVWFKLLRTISSSITDIIHCWSRTAAVIRQFCLILFRIQFRMNVDGMGSNHNSKHGIRIPGKMEKYQFAIIKCLGHSQIYCHFHINAVRIGKYTQTRLKCYFHVPLLLIRGNERAYMA